MGFGGLFVRIDDMKLLCVCLGNICRSPMAEGILRKLAREEGLDWEIRSAGTNRFHKGGPADARSVAACAGKKIDISSHIARRMVSGDFDRYDVIFTMADDVTDEMREFIRPESNEQDRLKIINFLDVLSPGENRSVPDPWYGASGAFGDCFELVNQASRAWIKKLQIP